MAATVYEVSAAEAASLSLTRAWVNVKNIITVEVSGSGSVWACGLKTANSGIAIVDSSFTTQAAAEARAATWVQRIEDAK